MVKAVNMVRQSDIEGTIRENDDEALAIRRQDHWLIVYASNTIEVRREPLDLDEWRVVHAPGVL